MKRCRARILTLIAVVTLFGGSFSAQEAWGQVTVSVNPRGTFLHTCADNPAPPTIVDLATAGFTTGDALGLTYEVPPPGFSFFSCGGPFVGAEQTLLLGVFSGSSTLLSSNVLARVPDAIDAGSEANTGPTFFCDTPDDIPEDFRIFPPSGLTIEVPSGATHLFLGMADSFYADNCGSIAVTLERQCKAFPVNFRETAGKVTPGGILLFKYKWDSNTGSLADLNTCVVGEKVEYPDEDPFQPLQDPFRPPDPPWHNWKLRNPTITNLPGSDGEFADQHGRHGFSRPYQEDSFDGVQIYRYHCDCVPTGEFKTLLGPLTIHREIIEIGGKFSYFVTKSGATASSALPGQSGRKQTDDIETTYESTREVSPMREVNIPTLTAIPLYIGGVVAIPQNVQGEVRVSFELADPVIGVGELTFVTFTIQNASDQGINVDLGRDRKQAFRFALQSVDGHLLTRGRTLTPPELTRIGRITIPAGSDYSEKLLLNEWLSPDTVGRFKLIAALNTEIRTLDTTINAPRSQEIEITVLPRDEQRLLENFQNLLTEALEAPTAEERLRAASAFQFATDVEAVPFLVELLKSGGVNAHLAMEPLAKIETTNAVQGLIAALHSENPELAQLAKGRLYSLFQTTRNPEIRSLIQATLQD